MKLAVVAPAETVTLAGTVAFALLLDSATAKPPVGAALLIVTVHAEEPGALTLVGEQESPLSTGGTWVTAIVPPVPDMGIALPVAPVAIIPLSATDILGLTLAGEIVNVAVATVPFGITAVAPNRTHVVDPLLPVQVTSFPAAVAAALGTTVTLVTSAG
ncbi:MAG: hypothetical protein LAP61_20360 [Acidobacteriia bacterium]|nr:hypothetical protein [Terriglobia bacterium]